jgi:5-methylcytosine-specific restriction endonuclease McrA
MIPPRDNYPERLQQVVSRYLEAGHDAGLRELQPISYPPREVPRRSGTPRRQALEIFRRDGWLCRYCGGRTIFEPMMALIGDVFPDDFPYHPNWKSGRTHPAVAARSAVIDHVDPGSRGGSWTDPENLVTACWPCNARKGDLTLDQLGWTLLPIPRDTGWDGLTTNFVAMWEKVGKPGPTSRGSWIELLRRLPP